jgi:hypothetical protein
VVLVTADFRPPVVAKLHQPRPVTRVRHRAMPKGRAKWERWWDRGSGHAYLQQHKPVVLSDPADHDSLTVSNWTVRLGISALRVNVKPRAPDSHETVLFKEAFSYRVVRKVLPVGKADAGEDYVERVLFIREHMLDAEPKLTHDVVQGLALTCSGCAW